MAFPSRFFASVTTNNRVAWLCGATILGLALAVSSLALANGLVRMKRADREVTVRGVAQRDVSANRASWRVSYSEQAYDLAQALAAVDRDTSMIRAYLEDQGFTGKITEPGSAEVSVRDEYIDNKPTGRKIYSVSRVIAFATGDVARVQRVQARKDDLAAKGLVVDSVSASYEYTQLDKIKPAMIAEATHDARRAAQKFANDSGSSVGGIRTATQGYFSVSSRDSASGGDYDGGSGQTASSPDQRVRVVTTIAYYLD